MAAQLKDEGRFPVIQRVSRDQFSRFSEACKHPPKASPKLKELMASASRKG